jgi:hypothetical protein
MPVVKFHADCRPEVFLQCVLMTQCNILGFILGRMATVPSQTEIWLVSNYTL